MMLWKRLQYLVPWRRRAAERDMQDELRSIAAMAEPRELGNLTLAAENARAEWGWTRLEQLGKDVRYALRALRKTPGFTATAVLSLALGIGANTALFTLVNAVTWRLLPVQNPEGLWLLDQRQGAAVTRGFSYQQYRLIRDHNDVLDLAADSPIPLNVAIDGHPEPTIDGQMVSGAYFPLLGVRPAAGRMLEPDDDRMPMGHPVAMISHRYWKARFGLDPGIVGRQIALSGVVFTIVGVAPPEFFGVEVGTAPQVFVPVMMQPAVMPVSENLLDNPNNGVSWLKVVARLKPGVSASHATAVLASLAQVADWRPRNKFAGGAPVNATLGLTSAATGLSDLRTQFSLPLRVLMGVVAIVLLIACANTGNLVLARSAVRRAEFALRLALGAGRSRLIQQLLMEGLVLAILAGAAGIILAYWATQILVTYVSSGRSAVVLDLAPDTRVLAFTAAVSLLTGVLFGIGPAVRASRLDLTSFGRQDLAATRHALGGPQPASLLVIAQVALSLLLLAGAGLFVRSLQKLNAQQLDVDRTHVLVVRVEPRGSDQRGIPGTSERLDRIYRDLQARVERIPGVLSASLARTVPLAPVGFVNDIKLASGEQVRVATLMLYPHYFETMGMPLSSGRDFDERDLRPDSPLVAVVNEAFVRQLLKGQTALGVRHGAALMLPGRPPREEPFEIIGVVKDSPYPDLREQPAPTLYQTFLQTHTGRGQMVLHVRATGPVGPITSQARDVVQAVDRDVPMFTIHTLADEVDATLVRERLIATLSAFFGVVALLLVCVGLYGLMSFTVSRRTAEIGVRMALGARRADVVWMVARHTLTLVLIGIAAGLPIGVIVGRMASRQLSGMLFDLAPTDPFTMAAAAGVLLLVAMAAGSLPARRAASIDPTVALRND